MGFSPWLSGWAGGLAVQSFLILSNSSLNCRGAMCIIFKLSGDTSIFSIRWANNFWGGGRCKQSASPKLRMTTLTKEAMQHHGWTWQQVIRVAMQPVSKDWQSLWRHPPIIKKSRKINQECRKVCLGLATSMYAYTHSRKSILALPTAHSSSLLWFLHPSMHITSSWNKPRSGHVTWLTAKIAA